MKNWKTSIFGALGGVPMILEGIATKDKAKIVSGISLVVLGLLAKDHSSL